MTDCLREFEGLQQLQCRGRRVGKSEDLRSTSRLVLIKSDSGLGRTGAGSVSATQKCTTFASCCYRSLFVTNHACTVAYCGLRYRGLVHQWFCENFSTPIAEVFEHDKVHRSWELSEMKKNSLK